VSSGRYVNMRRRAMWASLDHDIGTTISLEITREIVGRSLTLSDVRSNLVFPCWVASDGDRRCGMRTDGR